MGTTSLDVMRETIRRSPTNGLAHARLAQLILRQEGYDEPHRAARAEVWSRRAVALSPEQPSVWLARADILQAAGKLRPAADFLNEATRRHPGDPDLWHRRGRALSESGAWAESVSALKQAASLCPPRNKSPHRRILSDLRGALFQCKPPAEATREWLSFLKIPKRAVDLPDSCLDLSAHYNASLRDPWHNRSARPNTLASLPRGRQTLGGIEFDVRGVVQTASRGQNSLEPGFPEAVRGIEVEQRCQRLRFLHGAAFAYRRNDGKYAGHGERMGAYLVRYADGLREEIPLVTGENIDEWHAGVWSPSRDLERARLAWEGHTESGIPVRLHLISWNNPRPDVAIETLDFVSDMAEAAPFLIAITAEP